MNFLIQSNADGCKENLIVLFRHALSRNPLRRAHLWIPARTMRVG